MTTKGTLNISGGSNKPKLSKINNFRPKIDTFYKFLQNRSFSDFMEYGKITPVICRNRPHRSHFWTNFLLLLMLKDSVIQYIWSKITIFHLEIRIILAIIGSNHVRVKTKYIVPFSVITKAGWQLLR